MYHIHVDSTIISSETDYFLRRDLGFSLTNFCGHSPLSNHFESPIHYTFKSERGDIFSQTFNLVKKKLMDSGDEFSGYLEGEFVPLDIEIQHSKFDETVSAPFSFTTQVLPEGKFREDEIHITLDRHSSDPRALMELRRMGFFSAYMGKEYGESEIFTIQGTYHQITQILPEVRSFLEKLGGLSRCSLKEERIIKWWLSDSSVTLPPVIEDCFIYT